MGTNIWIKGQLLVPLRPVCMKAVYSQGLCWMGDIQSSTVAFVFIATQSSV